MRIIKFTKRFSLDPSSISLKERGRTLTITWRPVTCIEAGGVLCSMQLSILLKVAILLVNLFYNS
jgi:hypothetical protein